MGAGYVGKARREGYYWLHAERSSARGVAQWLAGAWYCINEVGPISEAEMLRRGWEPVEFIGSANR